MRRIIFSLAIFLVAFTFSSFSQDIIYKKDGTKEEAKITLVAEKEIQYKKFNNLEGPVYALSKSQILMITYENGEYEMLTNMDDEAKQARKELSKNFNRNLLSYHLFDVIYGDFTFSYERILSSGTIGISVPRPPLKNGAAAPARTGQMPAARTRAA